MKLSVVVVFIYCCLLNGLVYSQSSNAQQKEDTTSVSYALKSGDTHIKFRYFFCNTINNGNSLDYFANGTSGALSYNTNKFKRIYVKASGFSYFNIGSSNLNELDPNSNQPNRYEIGLFDLDQPNFQQHASRLDELFIHLNFKKGFVRFGKQFINTPLMNEQDGRLRGTSFEGVYSEYSINKKIQLFGAWIYSVTPRSTSKWYSIQESIGVNSQGVNALGEKSNYRNHITTKGVSFIGIKINVTPNLGLQAWDYIIDNVLNTFFIQLDYSKILKNQTKLIFATQLIHQQAINNGGNFDQLHSYTTKGANAISFGTRMGLKKNRFQYTLNFNTITNNGRYVFPREWGRDGFFTFLQRERNEGSGNVNAIMVKIDYIGKNDNLKIGLGSGYYKMSDVKNFAFNKYGIPSYYQINLNIKYNLKSLINGLEAELILASKINAGETYQLTKYEVNKVNLLLTNIILNYHF